MTTNSFSKAAVDAVSTVAMNHVVDHNKIESDDGCDSGSCCGDAAMSVGGGIQILDRASSEIELMRNGRKPGHSNSQQHSSSSPRGMNMISSTAYHTFPPACLTLLHELDGSRRCMDCGEHDPQWAAVSYGALLCLNCSGHHRSLGVHVSYVRSISMDEWSAEQVVAMLEGGNQQLENFFSRHQLTMTSCCPDTDNDDYNNRAVTSQNVTRLRYKTKAALFYRQQMKLHVIKVLAAGPYRGRAKSRNQKSSC